MNSALKVQHKEVTNYVLASALSSMKKTAPYYFLSNDKFYPKFNNEINKILKNPETIVIIHFEEGPTPYHPWNFLKTDKRVKGWAIGGPGVLYGLYVRHLERKKGYGKAMLNLLYTHIDQPKQLRLHFLNKTNFNFARYILHGKCRVFVEME